MSAPQQPTDTDTDTIDEDARPALPDADAGQ